MDVDSAEFRNRQHLGRKDLPEGRRHKQIGLQRFQRLASLRAADALKLQHGDAMLLCADLDRRGRELALAADGTIRLGHRAHDLIARADQRLQRRHGKLRRAHENNAHRFNSLRQSFFSFCCSL